MGMGCKASAGSCICIMLHLRELFASFWEVGIRTARSNDADEAAGLVWSPGKHL